MLQKKHEVVAPSDDRGVQQARTERILESAAALLVQWGYKRVTIDDIAQHAGIGTGTVYLHWKTKEALFESVLLRELQNIWGELAQRVKDDPREALLHRFLSALLRVIKQRPLARALFTRDTLLLGKLAQGRLVRQNQAFTNGEDFLAVLRELGLMRSDTNGETQAHAFGAIWTGFVFVDQMLQPPDRPSLDVQSEALIHTIQHTFEPDILPDEEALREHIAPWIIALLEQARDHAAQELNSRILP